MKKLFLLAMIFLLPLALGNCEKSNTEAEIKEKTIVDHLGQLKISGTHLVDQYNNVVVLRGMSLFWSNWGGYYYNEETIQWLRDDWKCTVIRAAIGVDADGGYIESRSTELAKLYTVIDACIELGIYVIVDWHTHHAEDHISEAIEFFRTVSAKYGNHPNIIYEIYNEPLDISWVNVIKPYAEGIISVIRENDTNNVIVVGTRTWSQDVDDVIGNRIDDPNVAYSLHFYTGTHQQSLRDKATSAITAGIPVFASEWGLSQADGNGDLDMAETNLWLYFLERNDMSWCNWSIINKDESSAALLPSTTTRSGWDKDELTQSGRFIRTYLISQNTEMYDSLK